MNTTMTISHRLFAAAVTEAPEVRKPKPAAARPVVIEVPRDHFLAASANVRPVAGARPAHSVFRSVIF